MLSQPQRARLWAGALVLLVGGYAAVLISNRSSSVGGSDATGYLNSARALAAGLPVQPIEPLTRFGLSPEDKYLFIPLGFVPGPKPGTMATFYPSGLPLQILVAAKLAGWEEGPFLVSPLFAAACLALIFLLARELGVTRAGSLACTVMLASSPVLAFEGVQLMSDAAAAAWALAAMLCALRARRRPAWALLAGLAFGVGVLVRPASAILLVPLVFALPARPRDWGYFCAGGAPCAIFFFAFNQVCYGAPLRTGYGAGGALSDFKLSNFPVRLRHYLFWISVMMTPFVPASWLLFSADRLRPPRVRAMLLSWFAVFFLLYCFYGPYEAWWYTRYLLPALPALLLASVMLAEDLLSGSPFAAHRESPSGPREGLGRRRAAVAAAVLAAACVCAAGVRLASRYDVLKMRRGQAVYPETLRWASRLVPDRSVVLAMELTGAMRAYGWGTFVRWDYIEAQRFPVIRNFFQERGYGVYALLFPYEVRLAAAHVPGAWTYVGSWRDVSLWRLTPADAPPPD